MKTLTQNLVEKTLLNIGEFMLGIPIHRIGVDIRKSLKDDTGE